MALVRPPEAHGTNSGPVATVGPMVNQLGVAQWFDQPKKSALVHAR